MKQAYANKSKKTYNFLYKNSTMSLILTSFLISLFITGILLRYRSWHLPFSGDHDLIGPQKFHQKVTVRIGGIAIALVCLLILGISVVSNPIGTKPFILITLAALPIFASGIVEDLTKQVSHKVRLFAAFFSGLLFLYLYEIHSIRLDIPIIESLTTYPIIAIMFLTFAIAGLSHAFNIIDGLNGLASMGAIISSTAILYVAIKVQDQVVINLALVMIGSIAGFFVWNFPKGLIFLGDGGAYLIGFLIAVASIILVVNNDTVSPWFAFMVNAYPISETLFTIWRRSIRSDKNSMLPDRTHLHSLIYLTISRWSKNRKEMNLSYANNSTASCFLWLYSILGAFPAVLWWNITINLVLSSIVFIIIYIYSYRMILKIYLLTANYQSRKNKS